MKNLTLLLVVILLASCGPKWHLKQALKHERKAMLKGAEVKTDTVWVESPVYVKEISVDTVLTSAPGDTVYLEKEKLKIKYVNLPGDSVFIEGACEADTIIQKVPVRIEKVIYAPQKGLKLWQWILIALAVGLILGILIRR